MAEQSVEDAAEIQELLMRWRFEYVDDCLERIDEQLRVLVEAFLRFPPSSGPGP